jgi:hypothetical protein
MSNLKYRWQNKNPEWSDERLITAYISTENAAYVGELFYRYSDMIFGLCLKHLKNVQESEDASYELFELLISKLKTQQIMIFKPWLYRTASNFCIDKLRKSKTNIIISLEDRFENAGIQWTSVLIFPKEKLCWQKLITASNNSMMIKKYVLIYFIFRKNPIRI